MYIWVYNKSKDMRAVLQRRYPPLGLTELDGHVDQRQPHQCDCRNDCHWSNKPQQPAQQTRGTNQHLC